MTLAKRLKVLQKDLYMVSKRGFTLILLSCIGIFIPMVSDDGIDGNDIFGLCAIPLAFISGMAFMFFRNTSHLRNTIIMVCMLVSFFLLAVNSGNIDESSLKDCSFLYGTTVFVFIFVGKLFDTTRSAKKSEDFREIFNLRRGWLNM